MRRPRRLGLAALGVLLLAPAIAGAQPAELPGADAIFAARGVAILWGIVRGPDEAQTRVVLEIERLDPTAPWRLVSVEARDPFTGHREWVRLAATLEVGIPVTVESSREAFVTTPSRRILFYRSVRAVQAGRPDFVVTYVSIPDTAPEFASREELDEHLRRVRERLPRP